MAEPFIAEIKIFGFNFAPNLWAFCDGQIVPASQNQAMFALLGNAFGGDARSTFGYPNLGGRVPIHYGTSAWSGGTIPYSIGTLGGAADVTLSSSTMPAHTHDLQTTTESADGFNNRNGGNQIGVLPSGAAYASSGSNMTTLNAGAVSSVGGGATHTNIQPYQAMNFCIALQGIFPSRD